MPRKVKKSVAQRKEHDDIEEDQLSQASSNMLEDMQPTDLEQSQDVNLHIILRELREFRKDSSQKLNDIREDIGIYKCVEEAEEHINTVETRIQSSESW